MNFYTTCVAFVRGTSEREQPMTKWLGEFTLVETKRGLGEVDDNDEQETATRNTRARRTLLFFEVDDPNDPPPTYENTRDLANRMMSAYGDDPEEGFVYADVLRQEKEAWVARRETKRFARLREALRNRATRADTLRLVDEQIALEETRIQRLESDVEGSERYKQENRVLVVELEAEARDIARKIAVAKERIARSIDNKMLFQKDINSIQEELQKLRFARAE